MGKNLTVRKKLKYFSLYITITSMVPADDGPPHIPNVQISVLQGVFNFRRNSLRINSFLVRIWLLKRKILYKQNLRFLIVSLFKTFVSRFRFIIAVWMNCFLNLKTFLHFYIIESLMSFWSIDSLKDVIMSMWKNIIWQSFWLLHLASNTFPF